MRFVALVSGGKDSFFSIVHCVQNGHELVALANLHPADQAKSEIDSFMFQTVGHDVIDHYSKCLDVPLVRKAINGTSSNVALEYLLTAHDEIEDLYLLLKEVKEKYNIEGVSCGAILSHYQRTRVENVCERLGLTSLTYLWQRDQTELMQDMAPVLDARLVKVAAIGLTEKHLGRLIGEMLPILIKLNQMYDVHVCGEGGEFETLVLDAPFFKKRLEIVSKEAVAHSSDVSFLQMQVEPVEKDLPEGPQEDVRVPPILQEEFQIIQDSLDEVADLPIVPVVPSAFSVNSQIFHTPTRLYVSNLTSTLSTIEEQTSDVLTQLASAVAQNSLALTDIQHMTVLVLDMANFGAVNGVYASLFGFPLPPLRVCVQTTLPVGVLVLISAIVLRNAERIGIHIRSRSYWGPQNIGPYSQSIVEQRGKFKTASLSGQIPLIPANMVLATDSCAVLALQHLYRVKSMVGVRQLASCVCYVTTTLPQSVAHIWKQYVSEVEHGQDFYRRLMILQVTGLPRGATVEWGGLAYEKVVGMYEDEEEETPNDLGLGLADEFTVNLVCNEGLNVVQIMSNDFAAVVSFLKHSALSNSYVSVLTSLDHIHRLANLGLPAEWVPVTGVWDSEGKPYAFGIIWIS